MDNQIESADTKPHTPAQQTHDPQVAVAISCNDLHHSTPHHTTWG